MNDADLREMSRASMRRELASQNGKLRPEPVQAHDTIAKTALPVPSPTLRPPILNEGARALSRASMLRELEAAGLEPVKR